MEKDNELIDVPCSRCNGKGTVKMSRKDHRQQKRDEYLDNKYPSDCH